MSKKWKKWRNKQQKKPAVPPINLKNSRSHGQAVVKMHDKSVDVDDYSDNYTEWWKERANATHTHTHPRQAPILPPCHELQYVFTVGRVKVWAGKQRDVLMHDDWDLIIQCYDPFCNKADVGELVVANSKARAILPTELLSVSSCPHILIEWEDYEAPRFPRAWWVKLIEWMTEQKEEKNIAVCCVGGHGRTGSVLSVIAGLCSKTDADPVDWIREIYCDNAVESRSQIIYIEQMTDIPIKAKPNWAPARYQSQTPGCRTPYTTNSQGSNTQKEFTLPNNGGVMVVGPTGTSTTNEEKLAAAVAEAILGKSGEVTLEIEAEFEEVPVGWTARQAEIEEARSIHDFDYDNPTTDDMEDPDFDWDRYMQREGQIVTH